MGERKAVVPRKEWGIFLLGEDREREKENSTLGSCKKGPLTGN